MTLLPEMLVLVALVAAATPIDLEPCPETPNCVSTQAGDPEHAMQPIRFSGTPSEARTRLLDLLESQRRVRVVEERDWVIKTEFTTAVFRFTDDVVFLIDPEARVIHFRSASRVGRSDLGANRRRMERLTKLFREADTEAEP